MPDNTLDIIVNLISEGVEQGLEGVKEGVEEAAREAAEASRDFSNLQSTVISLNQTLDLAAKAVRLVGEGFKLLDDALIRGQEVDNVSTAFERFQQAAGNDATQALEGLKDSTQGLVREFDLMKAANQAVLLGLPTEGFNEAAGAAVELGKAMGIDALSAIESFTTGVGRQSIQMLDNLGIIVSAETANEKYAASLGKTVKELTDVERKTAFANEAYSKLLEKSKDLGTQTLSAGDSFTILKNEIQNTIDGIAKAVNRNEDLAEALAELRDVIKEIDLEAVASGIATIAASAIKATKPVLEFGQALLFLADPEFIRQDSIKSAINGIEKELGSAAASIAEDFQSISQDVAITEEEFIRLNRQFEVLSKVAKESGKDTELLESSLSELDLVLTEMGSRVIPDVNVEIEQMGDAANEAGESVDDLNEKTGDSCKKIKEQKKCLSEAEQAAIDTSKAIGDALVGSLEKLGDGEFNIDSITESISGLGKAVGAIFGKNIGEGLFEDGFNIPGLEGVFSNLGIGEKEAGAIGGAVGGAYVSALTNSIVDSISGFGESTGDTISATLTAAFPTTGISFLDEPIANFFNGVFGGNKDPGANVREGFADYIRKLIEESAPDLQLVIDDELQKLDFDILGGRDAFDPDGSLTQIFEELSDTAPETVASINGVGNAMIELLGITDTTAGQIGTILFENVGQDLNNLQILLGELGFDAEKLGEALENAYLDGEIKAQDFIEQSAQIEDLFADGIPGAVGATLQAFNNFAKGGAASGRIAQDAIGDLAAEYIELGGSATDTLDGLQQSLIDQGASVQDVETLFAAFAANGIDSIGQLSDATIQQTAAIVAFTENAGFAFENTVESIKEARDALDDIPDEKTIRIRAEVETVALDNGAQDVIDSGFLEQGLG